MMMMMIMIAGFVDSISTGIKCWSEHMQSSTSSIGANDQRMSIKEVDIRDEELCMVCLSEVGAGDRFAVLERCGHGFHVDCVEAWLKEHPNCPLCRTPVFGADHMKKSYHIITRAALRLMETIATCLTTSFTHQALHSSLSHTCNYL